MDAMVVEAPLLWSEPQDFAIGQLKPRDNRDEAVIPANFDVGTKMPAIGDPVMIVGYDLMKVHTLSIDAAGACTGHLEYRIVLRVGRVTSHQDSLGLVTGPCIETTIPLAPGMSGSPVFYFGDRAATVFGLASHDMAHQDESTKRDTTISGRSVVAMLPVERTEDKDEIGFSYLLRDYPNVVMREPPR